MWTKAKTEALPLIAAQDLNDELIIILSGLDDAQHVLDAPEMGLQFNEERLNVREAIQAAIRLAQVAGLIVANASHRGVRGIALTVEALTRD